MKARKRGRRPLGRKAMTAAERQARRRQRLREAERKQREAEQPLVRRPFQSAPGYGRARAQLRALGHHFEWARDEWGFEGGVFVDGAFLSTDAVVSLVELTPGERQQHLAEARKHGKDFACNAVEGYMHTMRVSLDELIRHTEERQREWRERDARLWEKRHRKATGEGRINNSKS